MANSKSPELNDVAEASGLEHNLSDASPGGAPSRKKRCFSGCAVCRARKVKCDERSGGCYNCERLQLKCPGNSNEDLPPARELQLPLKDGEKRKKTYRSCMHCRASKTRCSGERPVCARCARKQIHCTYDSDPDPAWARTAFSSTNSTNAQRQRDQSNGDAVEGRDTSREAGAASTSNGGDLIDNISHSSDWDSIAWLNTVRLPDRERLGRLIDQYFANVHPLRCFSFIHKPSFMQRLDESGQPKPSTNALLYAVCALGAKFYALDFSTTTKRLLPHEILAAGNTWANEALKLIFADCDAVSVEKLMASVLLHDHELRIGRFASAFMLSGVSARMAQALQMNVEFSTDILCTQPIGPSPAAREARRRLWWSCYVMDAWVGSGVDQLTLIDDTDIKVQLPSSDRLFTHQVPAVTETIDPGRILKFIPRESLNNHPAENMGIAAYFVRLTMYRKKVLRFVKHLDITQPPWLPGSEFASLDRELRNWMENLPTALRWTPNVQYIRKDSSQLGALCHFHCTYHQTMCDLYRIGMPRLFKIRQPVHYPPERLDFLSSVQETCFYHASQIAAILQTASRHGVKTLADTWLAVIAHDTNRVMLYYLTKVIDPNADSHRKTVNDTLPLVRSNLEVLKLMMPLFSMSKSLYEASASMAQQSGLADHMDLGLLDGRQHTVEGPTAPSTPVQTPTPDYVLNPLAIYRLARKVVPEKEKHAPELIASSKPTPAASDITVAETNVSATTNTSTWQQSPFTQTWPIQQPPAFVDQSSPYANVPNMGNFAVPLSSPATSFDDLQMFFTADFDTNWQPADTILESSQSGGIPPWESESRPRPGFGGPQMDMFIPSYPWPLSET